MVRVGRFGLLGMVHPEAAASTGAAASQMLGAANELSQQSEMLRGKVETFLAAIKAA